MKLKLLASGTAIVGAAALREAFAGDYQQLIELLRGALRELWKMAGVDDPWPYVKAVYPESIVAERDGKLWRYPYTIGDDSKVSFGAPVQVIQRYVPIDGAMREAFDDAAIFLEADKAKKGRFKVRIIRAGLSLNGNFYPDAVLREAVSLFSGVRVFNKTDEEHLRGQGKSVDKLIGRLVEPVFVEGAGPDQGEMLAFLELIEPDGAVGAKLREAVDRGMTELFGLSVDMSGPARERKAGGRTFREAVKIRKVASVDLIVEPGAGGQIINFVEASIDANLGDPEMKLRERMISTIKSKKPVLLQGVDVETIDEEKLEGMYREALGVTEVSPSNSTAEAQKILDQARETARMIEVRAAMREAIAGSNLPTPAKAKLTAQFGAMERFTEADVEAAIKAEREYIARFTESGRVQGLGEIRIETGETRAQKVRAMLDAFFDPGHKDHRHAQSFKECYIQITGDRRVTGMLRDCDEALMRESLDSSSFDDVLGNSITRRLLADYRTQNQYDVWRPIADTVPAADFRTQERTRYGGYGDLPTVAEGAPYAALTSPTDEKATYAVAKKGGTEDVTLEMIKNDDVGVIRKIPTRLSRAAKRTLAKFVLDFIRTNPTIYDSVAFFHASHGNLGSAALDATSLAARRLAMLKQTELSSADRIGIGPAHLLVPADLQETSVNLFNRNTNNDKTFVQSMTLNILPVWYWTDTNDWALAADKLDIAGIEIGFLDGNEEPELFVQDSPTNGSMFSHEKLTWKIRHIYGGNVVDYRAFDKSVVA